jgi:hypothetical protein
MLPTVSDVWETVLMQITDARIISVEEARRLIEPVLARHLRGPNLVLALDRELCFDDEYDTSGVLLLAAGTVIEGDLVLDFETAEHAGKRYRGVLALGALTIKGDIRNDNGDGGPFLVALGPVSARNILKGGSAMVAGGPLTASGTIYCAYNHGVFRAFGGITARGLIFDDHRYQVVGPVDAIRLDLDRDDPAAYLLPKFLYEEDARCDSGPSDDFGDLIKEHILSGKPIFRPDAPRTKG